MKKKKPNKGSLYFEKEIPGLLLAAKILEIKLLDGLENNIIRKEAADRLRDLTKIRKSIKYQNRSNKNG